MVNFVYNPDMSFIQDLLWLIDELGELLPENKLHYRSVAQSNRPLYYKSLSRLEQQGYIKRSKKKSRTVFVITPSGKKLLSKRVKQHPRRDGLSTLIAYDIPSEKNRERTIFRRYLIKNGFTLIQKSLLVSPNQMDADIIGLARELKIVQYMKIISGKFDYYKLVE
jgi:DNA-binding transcriptional regulator PaaX